MPHVFKIHLHCFKSAYLIEPFLYVVTREALNVDDEMPQAAALVAMEQDLMGAELVNSISDLKKTLLFHSLAITGFFVIAGIVACVVIFQKLKKRTQKVNIGSSKDSFELKQTHNTE